MKNLNSMSKQGLIEEVKRLKQTNYTVLEKEVEITNNALGAQLDTFFLIQRQVRHSAGIKDSTRFQVIVMKRFLRLKLLIHITDLKI